MAPGVVPVHVAGGLHEHATRPAGGVEKLLLAGDGLEDFNHVLHDRGWSVERAAVLSLGEGEVAKEVFVDLAEEVNRYRLGDVFEHADDLREEFRLLLRHELPVNRLGEDARHLGVLALDGLHRVLDERRLVRVVGSSVDEIVVCLLREVESAFLDGYLARRLCHAGVLQLVELAVDFSLVLLEENVRVP